MKMSADFGIKAGYKPRLDNQYFPDEDSGVTWQPDVYNAAITIARRFGAQHIIDIGSGNGLKLAPVEDEFSFTFIDFGDNLKTIRGNMKQPGKHEFIDKNFEKSFPKLDKKMLSKSVVICSDVIEHIVDPTILAKGLKQCMDDAPFVFISTPDRPRTWGVLHMGPPPNPAHVREWSMEELDWYMRQSGVKHLISGYTRSNDLENNRNTILQIGGTFIRDLFMTGNQGKIAVEAPQSASTDKASSLLKRYYEQAGLDDVAHAKTTIRLPKAGFLDSVIPDVSVKQLLSNALTSGYGTIEVTLLGMNGPLSADERVPVSANYRQHGKHLTYRGTLNLTLDSKKSGKTYPLNLILVLPKTGGLKLFGSHPNLIDGGHLKDDYLLEILAGIEK
ncbi:MAG TPA: methyltransferase domain-containing protein [Candidatus Saccharimonadales bacterium]|nr:methyltransferase domain-containing protein [Candidatus Saccharimonadales bacterium]